MTTQIRNHLMWVFTVLMTLAIAVSGRADDAMPPDESGDYVESEAFSEGDEDFSDVSSADADEEVEIDDAVLDDALAQIEQPAPETEFDQAEARIAGRYGARVDNPDLLMTAGDGNPALAHFGTADISPFGGMDDVMVDDAGFMTRGMDRYLPQSIVANTHVGRLFQTHSRFRQSAGIELSSAFTPLVNFIENYIRTNAREGAERTNGLTHRRLAVQVVRASFCFGTDPFMMISKMRRETHFSRAEVSSTGAVGFSQMTGAGIDEVEHQMSGDTSISVANARSTFRQAIRCFTGLANLRLPSGSTATVKARLQNSWALDLIYGQIHMKTLVSKVKADGVATNSTAYQRAFEMYNGQTDMVPGSCSGSRRVEMRVEYGCDVIRHFNNMSTQWNRFNSRRQSLTQVPFAERAQRFTV